MTIYDNKGETIDRYSVVTASGDVFNMCSDANSPQGVNSYAGNLNEDRNLSLAGEVTELHQLPVSVLVAIIQRLDRIED